MAALVRPLVLGRPVVGRKIAEVEPRLMATWPHRAAVVDEDDAPHGILRRSRLVAGCAGASQSAFKLSRIHVERVIASARERRFHAARSFGSARTRTMTDLMGGFGMWRRV